MPTSKEFNAVQYFLQKMPQNYSVPPRADKRLQCAPALNYSELETVCVEVSHRQICNPLYLLQKLCANSPAMHNTTLLLLYLRLLRCLYSSVTATLSLSMFLLLCLCPSLSLSMSLCFSFFLPLCLYFSLSATLSLSMPLFLFICISVSFSVSVSLYLPSLSLSMPLFLFICLSVSF